MIMTRSRSLPAALACAAALSAPASAQVDSFLFGKPMSKTISPGIFEVTARGNNLRHHRPALDMALIKAAKRAAKQNGRWFAVVRQKSGTWTMNGRSIGDETTLRCRIVPGPDPVLDDKGAPARVYSVAEILGRAF
jgi:hypothetical protein